MPKITPVILCGGSGSRLWPLSRKTTPKQFVHLFGEETLYQSALKRLSGPQWNAPVVVTADAHLQKSLDQAEQIGVPPASILVEPTARNTGPAILATALHLSETDPDAMMLIAPSDHSIPDAEAFRHAVHSGFSAAASGAIVTFGIVPTRPETGYGWLELDQRHDNGNPVALPLKGFVEKPDFENAMGMFESGRFLWNAGIFLASARTLIKEFSSNAQDLMMPVHASVRDTAKTGIVHYLAAVPWFMARDVSVDYAIMEKAKNLCVVPYSSGWSDLGDWDAMHREADQDENCVASRGDITAIDCQNSLLRNEVDGVEVVGIGLDDTVVVAMEDAILVANKNRVQEVKNAVAQLKEKQCIQAEAVLHRDNGDSIICSGTRYTTRYNAILNGFELKVARSSPKMHWTLISGKATIEIDGTPHHLSTGSCLTRETGQYAQLSNPDDEPAILVEVRCEHEEALNTTPRAISEDRPSEMNIAA